MSDTDGGNDVHPCDTGLATAACHVMAEDLDVGVLDNLMQATVTLCIIFVRVLRWRTTRLVIGEGRMSWWRGWSSALLARRGVLCSRTLSFEPRKLGRTVHM